MNVKWETALFKKTTMKKRALSLNHGLHYLRTLWRPHNTQKVDGSGGGVGPTTKG